MGADSQADGGLGQGLTLRPATMADADALLRWRNDPLTRAMSRGAGEVAPADHRAWMAATLADPDRMLLVGESGGAALGVVRFDHAGGPCWTAHVNLAPEARGRGLGRALLRAGLDALRARAPQARVGAEIRSENAASRRVFAACGFVEQAAAEGMVQVRLAEGG